VANVGPVSVGIEASFLSMQFYSSGVYFEPECNPQNINRELMEKLEKSLDGTRSSD
jgi:hypothetical protein